MELFITLLIIVIIIGALLGGKSFGGTIRKGCGFLVLVVLILIGIGVFLMTRNDFEKNTSGKEVLSKEITAAYLIVREECPQYAKPDIQSEIIGYVEIGTELFVEDLDQYNYFYEVTDESGDRAFVRKECLRFK